MRPYSIDFRTKIVSTYETEKISIRQLAKRFGVATSFVQKIIKQYKETGELRPKRPGGSTPRKLTNDKIVVLAEIIDAHFGCDWVHLNLVKTSLRKDSI